MDTASLVRTVMVTCAMELSDHVIGVVKKDGTQKVDGIYVSTLVLISV